MRTAATIMAVEGNARASGTRPQVEYRFTRLTQLVTAQTISKITNDK
jgi:hypothetical protein